MATHGTSSNPPARTSSSSDTTTASTSAGSTSATKPRRAVPPRTRPLPPPQSSARPPGSIYQQQQEHTWKGTWIWPWRITQGGPTAPNLQLGSVIMSLPAAQSHNSFEILQSIQGDNYTTPPPPASLTPTLTEPPTAGQGTGSAGGRPRFMGQPSYGPGKGMEVDLENVFAKHIPDTFTGAMIQKLFTINDVVPDIFEHRPAFQSNKRNVELYYRDADLAAEAIRRFHKCKLDDRYLIHVMHLSHRLDPASGTRCAPTHNRAGTPSNSVARALGPLAACTPRAPASVPVSVSLSSSSSAAAAAASMPLVSAASDLASMSSMASATTSDSVSDRAASPAVFPARPGSFRGSARGGGSGGSSGGGMPRRRPPSEFMVPAVEYQEKPKLEQEYLVDLYNIPYLCPISALPALLLPHAITPYDVRKISFGHPSSPAAQARLSAMTPRQARSEHAGRVRLVFASFLEAEHAVDKLQAGDVFIEERQLHGRPFGVWRKGFGLERDWPAGHVGERLGEVADKNKEAAATQVGDAMEDKELGKTIASSPADADTEANEDKREDRPGDTVAPKPTEVQTSASPPEVLNKEEPIATSTSNKPGPHGVFIYNTTQVPGSPLTLKPDAEEPVAETTTLGGTVTHADDDNHPHVHHANTVRDPPHSSHPPHDTTSHDGDASMAGDDEKPTHNRSSTLPPNTFASSPPHHVHLQPGTIPAHMGPRHGGSSSAGRPFGTPGTFYESSAAHLRMPHHAPMRRPGSGGEFAAGMASGRGEFSPSSPSVGRGGEYGGRGAGGGGGGFRNGRGGSPSGYMHRGGRGGGGYHDGGRQQHQQHRNQGEFGTRHDSVMGLADAAGAATMAVPVFGMIPAQQSGPTGAGMDAAAGATGAGMIQMLPPGAVVVTGDGTTAYVLPPQMVMAASVASTAPPANALGGPPGATSPRTPSAGRHDGQGYQKQQQPSGTAPQPSVSLNAMHMHQPQPHVHPAPPGVIHLGPQQPFPQHHTLAHQQGPAPSSSPPPIPAHVSEPTDNTGHGHGMLTIPSPPLPYSARNQLTPIGRMPGDMFPLELHKRLGDMQLLHMCCLHVFGVHPDASPDDLEVVLMACAVRPYDICVDPMTYKLSPPQSDTQQQQRRDQIMIVQVLSSDLAQDVFFKDTNTHLNQAMAMVNGRKFMGRMLLQLQHPQLPGPMVADAGVGTSCSSSSTMLVAGSGAT
ncbi:hypothetical protein BCR44DRAFT_1427423 [Catenaria anguillulae PL171]|uniref:Uncharacterized protein n=1 Tax=Catenaria anguillulae PL171 TaxID=765915 RepID=A0A1Y2HZP2_9FUNG|nr:hypothetical protein BCR44DRAFT_1427423 [Catenaria anguillulae PL171]